jgi:outer membrane protein OmpA-like peptidoglycan-associated protein
MIHLSPAALLGAGLLLALGTPTGSRGDILDLADGAVVVSSSGAYSTDWPDLGLVDGTTETGWCSPTGQAPPFSFVIELARSYRLRRLTTSSENAQEAGYPGISARGLEVWLSAQGPDEGFERLATIEAPQGGRQTFELPEDSQGQWLKLVVTSNWGDASFTELMELEAEGDPVGPLPEGRSVTGIYRTNYGLMRLEQRGTGVEGCYDWDGGTLRGSTDGRVLDFEWREDDGRQVGTAVLVLDSAAEVLNGLWYEQGQFRGIWQGPRAAAGEEPECRIAGDGESLAQALSATGRAILYGIYFDSDSATLTPESEPALGELLDLLAGTDALSVILEGHTDSSNTDAHNLELSQNRAAAVREWLVAHGIEASRLTAQGIGEARPVADNDTPQGRRLNRRVEVVAAPSAPAG